MGAASIGDSLFTKTQQRVLGLLYGKPDQSFYANEIVRRAGMGRGTVSRELNRLASSGLLAVSKEGNQLHYRANLANPVFDELAGIVRKTFGIVDVIQKALAPVAERIDFAFIYGSVAKREDAASSDIDLLVAADSLSHADLMAALLDAEQSLGRAVNPAIYTRGQIKAKLKQGNAFLTRVMQQPKLLVKGGGDELRELG